MKHYSLRESGGDDSKCFGCVFHELCTTGGTYNYPMDCEQTFEEIEDMVQQCKGDPMLQLVSEYDDED